MKQNKPNFINNDITSKAFELLQYQKGRINSLLMQNNSISSSQISRYDFQKESS